MNFRIAAAACLLIALLADSRPPQAFETDQYNLAPVPLADIGDEMSEYVEENIRTAVGKLNSAITKAMGCIESSTRHDGCDSIEQESRELQFLRSEDAVAREVFRRLGSGVIPFTRSQTWLNSHKFRDQPARYKTGYADSIYKLVPSNYFTISPTVKMYGSSFGTDKIAHIFQQGYDYYRIRRKALRSGRTAEQATRKAVKQGVFAEKTYFGFLVSGVFSNADLAANYSGMLFYEGLTRKLTIGGVERPAPLELIGGSWRFRETAQPQLLKPFISDHLNEALNPSVYVAGLRSSVRGVVKNRSCRQWRDSFPERTKQQYESRSQQLIKLNGEDYGFRQSTKFVTIANTCF